MTLSTELQMVLAAAGVMLAANFIAVVLHFLYRSLSDSPLREAIRSVIYCLDKVADDMSNEKKRANAVQEINAVLGWRRILVPTVLIGWVIDFQIVAIRRMQRAAGTPNLHIEEDEHAQSNPGGTQGSRFSGQE